MDPELSDKRPHIILHVDINKTLIAKENIKGFDHDKCPAKLLSAGPEYALSFLASFVPYVEIPL